MRGARLHKMSRRDEMVRDQRRDVETFLAEGETRPRRDFSSRDCLESRDRDVEIETTSLSSICCGFVPPRQQAVQLIHESLRQVL